MKNSKNYIKYLTSLLMFGMNGIVASYIAMSSYEIVLTRTLIGSLLLIFIFIITKQKAHVLDNKKHLLFLVISGIAMGTVLRHYVSGYVLHYGYFYFSSIGNLPVQTVAINKTLLFQKLMCLAHFIG